ncbi:hypothetical protein N0V82_000166 [Gnomoniopsis sp. IMI 355080]|nr:hypothetical protein N0V82_000166 [Gnomoniopsis sp. IMI 355080]
MVSQHFPRDKMEQNGQNSSYPHSSYGYDEATFKNDDNNWTVSPMNTNPDLTLIDPALAMGTPQRLSAAQINNDVATKFNEDDFGSTIVDTLPPNNPVPNESSQNGAMGGSGRRGARGMQPAHASGSARNIPPRGVTRNHPYTRPQPVRSQAQVQGLQTQRRKSRRNAAGDMARPNATNAYTLPRSESNAVQPQIQRDSSRGMAFTADQMAARCSSSSMSPIPSTNVDTRTSAAAAASPAPADGMSTRPVYVQLDSSRIDPCGPESHSDPHWRAPGPSQWPEILHDHTLIVYLSDAAIKDVQKHCDRLVASGVPDPSNPNGLALVGNGQYNVLDAQQVWNYCTAYMKRRQQRRNNNAASRSRMNKAAQLKHWKAISLAAGASDIDFIFDRDDPGNASEAPSDQLAAVTQAAIAEMINNWARTRGPAGQASVAGPPTGLLPHQPPQYLDHSQIQQQVPGQPQNSAPISGAGITMPSHNGALPTTSAPWTMAAAPGPTASALTNNYQPRDFFEDFKLDLVEMDEDLVKDLQGLSGRGTYTEDSAFGGGGPL